MQRILDPSHFSVDLVESIVSVVYGGHSRPEEIRDAQDLMTTYKQLPDSWKNVDTILDNAKSPLTKFYALQILDELVMKRWMQLPPEERVQVRMFLSNFIVSVSQDSIGCEPSYRMMLGKANEVLVHMLKYEWPERWPTFTSDLIASSEGLSNLGLLHNNLLILKIMSEEVFNYENNTMTTQQNERKRDALRRDYEVIFNMCKSVLQDCSCPEVLLMALEAMEKYLAWMPSAMVLECGLVELIGERFLLVERSRNHAIRCLTEIASMKINNQAQRESLRRLFHGVMSDFFNGFPIEIEPMRQLYMDSQQDVRDYIENMAVFLTTLFFNHRVELEESPDAVMFAHKFLNTITNVAEKEIFKLCVEYWHDLSKDVFNTNSSGGLMNGWNGRTANPRVRLYEEVFSAVRVTFVMHMARPEEVILVEDDNGDLHKEYMQDVEMMDLYETMRQAMVLLTHLNVGDTERILLENLRREMENPKWKWCKLNTLCWAVGAISGAMDEAEERSFFIQVIRGLLEMCERVKGKENKAVIASNIMYVVGQYPRFLRSHYRFLKTVANKLVEFMHETFPGVMEMAVDTFLKLAKSCGNKLSEMQLGEDKPYIIHFLDFLPEILRCLQPGHTQVLYEAMGVIISTAPPDVQSFLVGGMFHLVTEEWNDIMERVGENRALIEDGDVLRRMIHLMRCEVMGGKGLGHSFLYHMETRAKDIVDVFVNTTNVIGGFIERLGPNCTYMYQVKLLRGVRAEALKMLQELTSATKAPEWIMDNMLPHIFGPILGNYFDSPPGLRESAVLSLLTVTVDRFRGVVSDAVPFICEKAVVPTLDMISHNMEDFPDHRVKVFKLMSVLNRWCFESFLQSGQNDPRIIQGILWAIKHGITTISGTGTEMLLEFLKNMRNSPMCPFFYEVFFIPIFTDVLVAMTDTMHKPDFPQHARIIATLLFVAHVLPRVSADQPPGMSSLAFIQQYLDQTIGNAFPNLTPQQITTFATALCRENVGRPEDVAFNEMRHILRDFVIESKEWGSRDAEGLFGDDDEGEGGLMQQVPGYKVEKHANTYNYLQLIANDN